jgi:hypothetical protein
MAFVIVFISAPSAVFAFLALSPEGVWFHHEIDALYANNAVSVVLPNGTTHIQHRYTFIHPESGRHVSKDVDGILATHLFEFVPLNTSCVHSFTFAHDLSVPDDAQGVLEVALTLNVAQRILAPPINKTVVIVSVDVLDHKGRHLQHQVLGVRNVSSGCYSPLAAPSASSLCTAFLELARLHYHDLFEHLSLHYEASHLPHIHNPSEQQLKSPAGTRDEGEHDESFTVPFTINAHPPQRRDIQPEGLFGWIAQAVRTTVNTVSTVASLASSALTTATSAAGTIAQLASGTFNWNKADIAIGSFVYNRQDTSGIQKVSQHWTFTGDVNVAVSTKMDSTLAFKLAISNYNLQSVSIDVTSTVGRRSGSKCLQRSLRVHQSALF